MAAVEEEKEANREVFPFPRPPFFALPRKKERLIAG